MERRKRTKKYYDIKVGFPFSETMRVFLKVDSIPGFMAYIGRSGLGAVFVDVYEHGTGKYLKRINVLYVN